MSVAAGRDKLAYGVKVATAKFDEASDDWTDDVRRQFTEQDWEPLCEHVRSALQAMDRLQNALHQMKTDCSEEGGF